MSPRTIFSIIQRGCPRDVYEIPRHVPSLSVGDYFVYEGLSYKIVKISYTIYDNTLYISGENES